MSGMKVKVLYLGQVDCFRYHLVATDDLTAPITSPMVALLIQHPVLGNVLYDTGNDPDWANTYSNDMITNYPITKVVTIEEALAANGLKPDDIDLLILSHLHFDHAGGLKFFANTKSGAKVIVSEADAREAFYKANIDANGEGGAYLKKLFCNIPGVGFAPISEDVKLADDLSLFIQKSHTPGVIGLILDLDKLGKVICTADTLYTSDSYLKQLPPGGTINKTNDEFFDNLKIIQKMEKDLNATIFYGHDIDQVLDWAGKGWIE